MHAHELPASGPPHSYPEKLEVHVPGFPGNVLEGALVRRVVERAHIVELDLGSGARERAAWHGWVGNPKRQQATNTP